MGDANGKIEFSSLSLPAATRSLSDRCFSSAIVWHMCRARGVERDDDDHGGNVPDERHCAVPIGVYNGGYRKAERGSYTDTHVRVYMRARVTREKKWHMAEPLEPG